MESSWLPHPLGTLASARMSPLLFFLSLLCALYCQPTQPTPPTDSVTLGAGAEALLGSVHLERGVQFLPSQTSPNRSEQARHRSPFSGTVLTSLFPFQIASFLPWLREYFKAYSMPHSIHLALTSHNFLCLQSPKVLKLLMKLQWHPFTVAMTATEPSLIQQEWDEHKREHGETPPWFVYKNLMGSNLSVHQ